MPSPEEIDPQHVRARISGAVARGWATPRNSTKILDSELAEDITTEVVAEADKVINEMLTECINETLRDMAGET